MSDDISTTPAGPASGLLRNLRAGIRLAAFQRAAAPSFRAGGAHLAAIVAAELLLAFFLRLVVVGPHGTMDRYELGATLFHLPLFLLAALLMGRLTGKRRLVTVTPIALCAILPPVEIVHALVELCTANGWLRPPPFLLDPARYFPFFGWWSLAALLALVRFCDTSGQRLRATLMVLLVLVLPLWFVPRGELWLGLGPDGGASRQSAASEETIYAQPFLLERQLTALHPGEPGVPHLYFVGFAGYAEEDVFRHEIAVISKLFDERFGTAHRSVTLVNSPSTLERLPIASRTALDLTLRQIGSIMNRNEDILFLYLTSHGSEEHDLEVSFQPLELDPIDPAGLKEMLAASGIRWKVIVVSACYSGGFVDTFRDDDTLVITASDKEHSSFGCGTESDFTYFGKAYFDEELRRSYSFTDAFARAKEAIGKREAAEGETPSNPQMALGRGIAQQLHRLEARLPATPPHSPLAPGTVR
ncbi:MAG TPA: C13 family peptidase [Geobacteraceae bacterium]